MFLRFKDQWEKQNLKNSFLLTETNCTHKTKQVRARPRPCTAQVNNKSNSV